VVLVVNQGAYVAIEATTISPGTSDSKQWRQVYTDQRGTEDPHQPWSSRGLEVTSTWQYFIRKFARSSEPQQHYICYTDIGLARSDDGGISWKRIVIPRHNVTQADAEKDPGEKSWINAYEIAEAKGSVNKLFIAVSNLHDIPQDKVITKDVKKIEDLKKYDGGVYWSNDGINWLDFTDNLRQPPNADNPNAHFPITSIIIDDSNFLWAAVFGDGIWQRDLSQGQGQWVQAFAPANKYVTRLRFERKSNGQASILCSIMAQSTTDRGGVFRLTIDNQHDPKKYHWSTLFDPNALSAGYPVDFGYDKNNPDAEHYFVGTLSLGGGADYGGVYEKLDTTDWQKVIPTILMRIS
jgi:hypothetical protein